MLTNSHNLKNQILNTVIWLVILPFLATWPFVSAFPLFGLINGEGSNIRNSLHIAFFLTGFWPLIAIATITYFIMHETARIKVYKYSAKTGPWIGVYAIFWTGLYLFSLIKL